MLSQNELERARYEAREQIHKDAMTLVTLADYERKLALVEGRAEGHAAGELLGKIHLCQKLLKRPLTARGELLALPLPALQQLAAQLEQELAP